MLGGKQGPGLGVSCNSAFVDSGPFALLLIAVHNFARDISLAF